MASTSDRSSEPSIEPEPATRDAERTLPRIGRPPEQIKLLITDHDDASTTGSRSRRMSRRHPWRKRMLWAVVLVGLGFGGYRLVPVAETMLNTISTDDAYVNGHVTFVAPRVSGQVSRVLVDDNYRVKKGALLVQLDKEPYQVQVAIKKAAVGAGRSGPGGRRSPGARTGGDRRIPALGNSSTPSRTVNNQVATLRANVATLESRKATLALAQANLKRGEELVAERGHQQGRSRPAPADGQGG